MFVDGRRLTRIGFKRIFDIIKCTYMDFEWDEPKNQANIRKHGVSFETAMHIFDRPVLTRPDRRID